ncbi:MAG: pyruvate dehydrogenase (acetyl-transferring) E1 component subunit alpha [Candidatus Diapherotrites archaeon]|uniref:Pyruvate dehydrogenase (Acetyl-transferring) E1 component subunit alpha n=1 Tax=Candidatus Iainarchaeum sp. TaxID=3101447 RepID=A0A8T4C738_9ARCH|nr:pyruvate dehydrogenase (acetyl-transferring) E1 component subunit alpha [Candidatus Diapherotrites archaeon]
MSLQKLTDFSTYKLSILDEQGKVDEKLLPKLSNTQLVELYSHLINLHVFDEKALKLQRQGRIGTYGSCAGQEACTVGTAYAMEKQDWTFPAFREHGVFMTRGVPMVNVFQYWGGDERGSKVESDMNCFPVAIPVGSQPLHAVGCALAMRYLKKDAVAIGYFGDGATSEGDTLEAMNFAGVFQAPVVLVCQNNQFAISEPRSLQTRAETIAQKAIAFGFEGIQVDGNDVLAVYQAMKQALEKARAGKGPTLLELYTYRMGDHTTADDSTRYRNKEELETWRKRDPIVRFKTYLTAIGVLTPALEEKIMNEAVSKVERAVQAYETMPAPSPSDMFDYMYAQLTPELAEQKKNFLAHLSRVNNASSSKSGEGPGFP